VVQQGRLEVSQLLATLQAMATQRSACYQLALAEISDGIRSVAEAQARDIVLESRLPEIFTFNPELWTPEGEYIACPDGYVERIAAGYEIDSFAYHLHREPYLRTLRRHRWVSSHGVWSLAFSPVEVVNEPKAFIGDLRSFLAHAATREIPRIIVKRKRAGGGTGC